MVPTGTMLSTVELFNQITGNVTGLFYSLFILYIDKFERASVPKNDWQDLMKISLKNQV